MACILHTRTLRKPLEALKARSHRTPKSGHSRFCGWSNDEFGSPILGQQRPLCDKARDHGLCSGRAVQWDHVTGTWAYVKESHSGLHLSLLYYFMVCFMILLRNKHCSIIFFVVTTNLLAFTSQRSLEHLSSPMSV